MVSESPWHVGRAAWWWKVWGGGAEQRSDTLDRNRENTDPEDKDPATLFCQTLNCYLLSLPNSVVHLLIHPLIRSEPW